MGKTTVSIAMITDENYAMPTSVAIESLICNKNNDTVYDIYILGNNLKEQSVNNFKIRNQENVNIKVLETNAKFNFSLGKNKYIPPSACLKFYLPEMFPNLDKILYLDSDIIVKKDLGEFFKKDISDIYAAVVTDYYITAFKSNFKELDYKYEKYFNSGVMLLNLKQMRNDDITQKLVNYKTNCKNFYMDQDAFNMVFNPKVEYVSCKYNFSYCLLTQHKNKNLMNQTYNEPVYEMLKSKAKDAIIVHYAYVYKPWKYKIKDISGLFFEYYKKSPYSNQKLKITNYYNPLKRSLFKRLELIKKAYW